LSRLSVKGPKTLRKFLKSFTVTFGRVSAICKAREKRERKGRESECATQREREKETEESIPVVEQFAQSVENQSKKTFFVKQQPSFRLQHRCFCWLDHSKIELRGEGKRRRGRMKGREKRKGERKGEKGREADLLRHPLP
jgi:hypothetical protein